MATKEGLQFLIDNFSKKQIQSLFHNCATIIANGIDNDRDSELRDRILRAARDTDTKVRYAISDRTFIGYDEESKGEILDTLFGGKAVDNPNEDERTTIEFIAKDIFETAFIIKDSQDGEYTYFSKVWVDDRIIKDFIKGSHNTRLRLLEFVKGSSLAFQELINIRNVVMNGVRDDNGYGIESYMDADGYISRFLEEYVGFSRDVIPGRLIEPVIGSIINRYYIEGMIYHILTRFVTINYSFGSVSGIDKSANVNRLKAYYDTSSVIIAEKNVEDTVSDLKNLYLSMSSDLQQGRMQKEDSDKVVDLFTQLLAFLMSMAANGLLLEGGALLYGSNFSVDMSVVLKGFIVLGTSLEQERRRIESISNPEDVGDIE